jgi:ERCC4-type nuclease
MLNLWGDEAVIMIDDRVGSIDLLPLIQSHHTHPRCTSEHLLSGDIAFHGEGPKGPSMVGIERKRIRDMINSIRTGRYSGSQLPTLIEYYDEYFLIIEGEYREGFSGALELRSESNGSWYPLKLSHYPGSQLIQYTELDHFLCTIESHTPVNVRRSSGPSDTVSQIISLYSHRQKLWDKHHSYQALHVPQSMVTIGKASFVRRVAAQLAGIGWEKSGNVSVKFKNVVPDMVNAGPEEWASVPGIGKTLAKRAFDQLRGDFTEKGEI